MSREEVGSLKEVTQVEKSKMECGFLDSGQRGKQDFGMGQCDVKEYISFFRFIIIFFFYVVAHLMQT